MLIPPQLFDLCNLEIQPPIYMLDDSGEFCRYCQEEDVYVQVQAYATDERGKPAMVSSCCTCLGWALFLAEVDMLCPVVVEYEKANPIGEGDASPRPAGVVAGVE